MSLRLFAVLLGWMSAVATGNVAFAQNPATAGEATTLLVFKEVEMDHTENISRAIVSAKYMRLDYGDPEGGYVLFDRNSGTVFNINHVDRTVLVIQPRPVPQPPPIPLDIREEHVTTEPLSFQNKQLRHDRTFANNGRCADIFSVAELLPDAALAFQSYYEVLAGEHAQSMGYLPADVIDACDLTVNIFAPDRPFRLGFPIQTILYNGRQRVLLDFDNNHVMFEKWYDIPGSYRRFAPADFRGDSDAGN